MKRETMKAYLLLLPAVLLALLFVYLPFLKSILSSFFLVHADHTLGSFVFLDNYRRVLGAGIFQESFLTTLKFMLLFVPLNTALVLLAATLTERKRTFTPIAETIFMLPLTLSMASMALIFKVMFSPETGIVNTLFHLHVQWPEQEVPALLMVAILGVFLDFGLDYLILLAALRGTNRDVMNAAYLDGCGTVQAFFLVRIPLMLRPLKTIVFLALKDAYLITAPIMILTEGGPGRKTQTLVYYYYLEAFKNGNHAYACAISTMTFGIAVLAGILYLLLTRRKEA